MITQGELNRIKQTMIIKSPEDLLKEKTLKESQRMEMQKMANTRKEKMLKLDKEREKKKPPNDLTLEQQQRA